MVNIFLRHAPTSSLTAHRLYGPQGSTEPLSLPPLVRAHVRRTTVYICADNGNFQSFRPSGSGSFQNLVSSVVTTLHDTVAFTLTVRTRTRSCAISFVSVSRCGSRKLVVLSIGVRTVANVPRTAKNCTQHFRASLFLSPPPTEPFSHPPS